MMQGLCLQNPLLPSQWVQLAEELMERRGFCQGTCRGQVGESGVYPRPGVTCLSWAVTSCPGMATGVQGLRISFPWLRMRARDLGNFAAYKALSGQIQGQHPPVPSTHLRYMGS